MPSARLADRGVVSVAGAEARTFLDRLVTSDIERVSPERPRYGALLTPQGKIIADFVLFQSAGEEGEFLLDLPAACIADFVKRLNLYKLRAKLAVADRTGTYAVLAGWDEAPPAEGVLAAAPDPRLPALGWRAVVAASSPLPGDEPEAYHRRRVGLSVPEGGRDFAFGDAFPHEAMMDQLGGVDFDKGCYVGQEVVSRMQHRGTARTRILPVVAESGADLASGAEVTGEGRALGRTGEAIGARALATLRIDRAGDALAAGAAILAGGVPVRIERPDWVRFPFPPPRAAAAS